MWHRLVQAFVVVSSITAHATPWAQQTGSATPGADPRTERREAASRRVLQEIHDEQKNIGLAAAVARNGEIVFTHTLGLANVEHEVPVLDDTRFLVASITKAFTGATLMKLREQGLIDLDAPVGEYLPGIPAAVRTVTLRQLAAHVAGIRGYREGEKTPAFLSRHFSTANDALEIFVGDPLESEPGTTYRYTSFGYDLLAAVVEAVAGKPFPRVVREEVLEPLALEDTGFHDVRHITPRLASNYTYYAPFTYDPLDDPMPAPREDYSYNPGGGNMYTTIGDLLRFARAHFEEGFFTAESLELLARRQGPANTDSPWGIGWFVMPGPERCIYITGAFTGTQAALYVWPERRIAVALLANCWGVGSASGDMVRRVPRTLGEIWSPGWRAEGEAGGR